MEWLTVIVVGILAGTHTATWGMYKDAPHEGFRRYPRSILVSTLVAPIAYRVIGLDASRIADMVILWGVTYVTERAITEFYKVYWRTEDQSKYFIPMQFHVFGRVVHSRAQRLLIGIPHAAVVIGLLFVIDWIQDSYALPVWVMALTVGGIGGWISAFGGAWKDAPIEGFEWLKFFRSPVVAGLYALLLTLFTRDFVVIALAAEGFTVATLETYKTFFFPSKPRGKFAGKAVHFPGMLRVRQRFLPLYILIWLTVIGGFINAFLRGEAI